MQILETKRLNIRHIEESDADFIHALFNTDTFIKYIGDRNLNTIVDAQAYIRTGPQAMYAEQGFGLFLVECKESLIPLGISGLIKRDTLDDIDVGYGFHPEHEGFGYALESTQAVVDYAKDDLGIRRLVAITTEENTKSIKLLNKLGLSFEKELVEGNEVLQLYGTEFTTCDKL